MLVAIALFALAAMVITLSASLLADVRLWGLVREWRRLFRELPPAQRRPALARLGWTYAVVAGAAAVVLTAPFGTRNTVLVFRHPARPRNRSQCDHRHRRPRFPRTAPTAHA